MISVLPLAFASVLLQAATPPLYLYTCGVPLPSPAEVETYVRSHWPDFEDRIWTPPLPAAERSELTGVRDVACAYAFATPSCAFTVTARRASGAEASARLRTEFARDERGRLAAEVIATGPDPACSRRRSGG
jgi:hypothetical protein